jgi:nucleotide-binding universal stress UspA family protein
MRIVLAALDNSAAARPVVEVAQRLAALLDARVEAVHVREDGVGLVANETADRARVPLRLRDGDVDAALADEACECDAVVVVIGARGRPGGASPAGHIALDLVQSLDRPIVVVPPHATDRPLRRVLVAVEGDGESHALRGLFEQLGDRPTPDVVALHVLEPHDLPMFADSPVLEAEAFEREFMTRVASAVVPDLSRVRLETRVGDAPGALRDAVRELDVDLVVMAWHRDLSEGHGRLVREMLAEASVPVVLLPRSRRERPPPREPSAFRSPS